MGDDANFLKLDPEWLLHDFQEDGCFIMAHCRGLIVFCVFADEYVHSVFFGRRTNPFGETDDDCSAESDGKVFPPLYAS